MTPTPYTHTLTRTHHGWHFQIYQNGKPDCMSTSMRTSSIADRAGQDYVDQRNGVSVGIEARLMELGL